MFTTGKKQTPGSAGTTNTTGIQSNTATSVVYPKGAAGVLRSDPDLLHKNEKSTVFFVQVPTK